jgi:hypothetical protein
MRSPKEIPLKNFARILRIGAPVLAGAVAGMTFALVMGGPRSSAGTFQTIFPSAHTSEAMTARSSLDERTSADSSFNQRIAALEKRIDDLSWARVDPPAPPSRAVEFESARETRRQRLLADHTELLAQHRSERRDPGWASDQERNVRTALSALSDTMKHSFSLQSVDCRTASCVAQLTWPSETAARLDADSFMGGSGAVRCAREMAFPPAEGAGPYTASLYLDCAEFRWGQVPGDPG